MKEKCNFYYNQNIPLKNQLHFFFKTIHQMIYLRVKNLIFSFSMKLSNEQSRNRIEFRYLLSSCRVNNIRDIE